MQSSEAGNIASRVDAALSKLRRIRAAWPLYWNAGSIRSMPIFQHSGLATRQFCLLHSSAEYGPAFSLRLLEAWSDGGRS